LRLAAFACSYLATAGPEHHRSLTNHARGRIAGGSGPVPWQAPATPHTATRSIQRTAERARRAQTPDQQNRRSRPPSPGCCEGTLGTLADRQPRRTGRTGTVSTGRNQRSSKWATEGEDPRGRVPSGPGHGATGKQSRAALEVEGVSLYRNRPFWAGIWRCSRAYLGLRCKPRCMPRCKPRCKPRYTSVTARFGRAFVLAVGNAYLAV
jgi:hypothetical protein